MEVEKKRCTKCGILKPISDFWNNKQSKDGKMSWCKGCMNYLKKKRKRELAKKVADMERLALSKSKPNDLSCFTSRQLWEELALRGYRGVLEYVEVKRIDITHS